MEDGDRMDHSRVLGLTPNCIVTAPGSASACQIYTSKNHLVEPSAGSRRRGWVYTPIGRYIWLDELGSDHCDPRVPHSLVVGLFE